MNTQITLGDDTYTAEKGKCYIIGYTGSGEGLSEITHSEYKEYTREMTRQAEGDEISTNIIYWYDDNGGVLFVKSK